MDLDWLKDFLALAEQGSFSRAADLRNVTQPAFSRRIRALEDWMGTALFIRSAQGATLTPAGAYFRPLAEDLMQGLDRARRDTQVVGECRATSLSIAATHALSFTFFPGWIRQYTSLDAFGMLNLISDSMAACEQMMLSGEVNFLLCHHHGDAPAHLDRTRFPSIRLGSDVLVALCAPGPGGRPAWPIPGKATAVTRLLGYSADSGLGRIVAAHQARMPKVADVETVFTSHLAATLLTMARGGQGVAWLPQTLAEEDLRSGQLVRAGAEDFDIPIDIVLFRSPDCRNRAADRLWDVLLKEAEHVA
jgi:LysR family transcriptional regulator, hypochlorite-specific transcription factor HypT